MIAVERRRDVTALVEWSKALLEADGLSRDTLAQIRARLEALAACITYWSDADYPDPRAGEEDPLYLIAAEPDQSFALYLNLISPGFAFPPHNHDTWACVAAVSGCEDNYLFERLDDGAIEGRGQIRQASTVSVAPGTGIALLPDDIHAIANTSGEITRHLHFYGRALETQVNRMVFDQTAGTYQRKAYDVFTDTRMS
jgi:predicted metal-dependent enzyme (double-stranded beta helix superfamily)